MPPLRDVEAISDNALREALQRAPAEHFVVWTGHRYGNRHNSLRSRALACVTEVRQPVPLRVLLSRAARLDGLVGLNPDTVRSGLRLHQGARPCVYLLAERDAAGDFRAVTEIPHAGPKHLRIRANAVVFDHAGRMCMDEAGKAAW